MVLEAEGERRKPVGLHCAGNAGAGRAREGVGVALDPPLPTAIDAETQESRHEDTALRASGVFANLVLIARFDLKAFRPDDLAAVRDAGPVGVDEIGLRGLLWASLRRRDGG